jgi:hypothetical protein
MGTAKLAFALQGDATFRRHTKVRLHGPPQAAPP